MKYFIIAFFLPMLVSLSVFSEEGSYDESHMSKCAMVGPEEKKLARDDDKVSADEREPLRLNQRFLAGTAENHTKFTKIQLCAKWTLSRSDKVSPHG